MEDLKEVMLAEGKGKGICKDGFSQMYQCEDVREMVDMYFSIPDWCLERDYPTLDMLSKHFSDMTDKGLFVGKEFSGEVFKDLQVYIFHNCKGVISVEMNYDLKTIPMLYFANGCDITIKCEQTSNEFFPINIPVYIFGKNSINAIDSKFATFTIYKNKLL